MANRLWVVEYQVAGHGIFPVDMLRYDCSYPAKSDGIMVDGWMTEQAIQERRVYLRHRDSRKGWEPTYDRWSSFGWTVDRYSVRETSI